MSDLVKILSVNQNFIYICFSSTNVQRHLIPNNLRDNTSGKRFISSWTGQNFNQCTNFSKCKSIRLDKTHVSTSWGSAYNLEAHAMLWTCLLVPRRALTSQLHFTLRTFHPWLYWNLNNNRENNRMQNSWKNQGITSQAFTESHLVMGEAVWHMAKRVDSGSDHLVLSSDSAVYSSFHVSVSSSGKKGNKMT